MPALQDVPAVGEPATTRAKGGEDGLDPSQALLAATAGPGVMRAQQKVIEDGEEREQPPPLEDVGQSLRDDTMGGQPVDALLSERDAPLPRPKEPRQGVHEG